MITLSLGLFSLFGQLNTINWQKTFGGSLLEESKIIVQTPDFQGYYLVSTSASNIGFKKSENSYGGSDIWVLYFDALGNLVWDKTYGGLSNDSPMDAVLMDNKLFILSTSSSGVSGNKTTTNYGQSDLWLLCLDVNGSINWQSSYGGSDIEGASTLKINQNNILLFGNSYSNISGNKTENSYGLADFWVLNIDTLDGTILNQKTLGSSDDDNVLGATLDGVGNIYVLGSSPIGISGLKTINGYGDIDHWLLKLNSSLQIVNQNCFGGTGTENPWVGDIIHLNNKLIVSGTTNSSQSGNITELGYGSNDAWIYNLDENLSMQWNKLYGGTSADAAVKIIPYSSNSLLFLMNSASGVSGNKTTNHYGGFSDIWVVLADLQGQSVYQSNFGGVDADYANNILLNNNNDVVIAGTSESGISGVKDDFLRGMSDSWVYELNTSLFLSIVDGNISIHLNTYPNPSNGNFTLVYNSIENSENKLELRNVIGQLLYTEDLNDFYGTYTKNFNITEYGKGEYFLTITNSKNQKIEKIIVY